jgi:hypothetical protein
MAKRLPPTTSSSFVSCPRMRTPPVHYKRIAADSLARCPPPKMASEITIISGPPYTGLIPSMAGDNFRELIGEFQLPSGRYVWIVQHHIECASSVGPQFQEALQVGCERHPRRCAARIGHPKQRALHRPDDLGSLALEAWRGGQFQARESVGRGPLALGDARGAATAHRRG